MSAVNKPVIGEPAPDFALRATTGATITLASLRGRSVVIHFMREFT